MKKLYFFLLISSQLFLLFGQSEIVLQQGLNGFSGIYDHHFVNNSNSPFKYIAVSNYHC